MTTRRSRSGLLNVEWECEKAERLDAKTGKMVEDCHVKFCIFRKRKFREIG